MRDRDVPVRRETKEGVRGQRPRRRSWWWVLAWPHRGGSCRLCRLSSSRIVGRLSWYVIIAVRVHCCSRSLSFMSIVVCTPCHSRPLSCASVSVCVH